jgi:hypothetical protein
VDKEEADCVFNGTEEGLCKLVVLGKVASEVLLSGLGERVGLDHQIQDCGWKGEGIKVALNFFLLWVLDIGIVYHQGNAIGFIVRVLDGCWPLSCKWESMITVTRC